MDRVKDISKMKIRAGYVLLKVHTKESLILAPAKKELSGPQVDYAEVIIVGPTIEDLTAGDIVIDFKSTEGFKWGSSQFAMVPRMNIGMAIERDNFKFKENAKKKPSPLDN